MTDLIIPQGLKIALIVATDKNRAIGKDNTIPWKHKADMKNFRETTTGHIVLMGRKTFESMGCRPLPKRHNIVVSSTLDSKLYDPHPPSVAKNATSCMVMKNLDDAMVLAAALRAMSLVTSAEDLIVYVIGGETLYRAFLPHAHAVYHNVIDTVVEGADAFFPEMDGAEWYKWFERINPADGDDLRWREQKFLRK